MRFTFPREFYIPKGAIKIADKQSDAVAYVRDYQGPGGKPRVQVVIFWGKAAKPLSNLTYGTRKAAEAEITRNFESCRKSAEFKKSLRDERKAFVPDYKVGDILYTSWGYDQTNVEYFQVVEARGMSVWLRQIGGEYNATGWAMGHSAPTKDAFLNRSCIDPENKPFRRLAQKHGIKIDSSRTAWKHTEGTTHYESSYA